MPALVNPITEDGEYILEVIPGRSYLVLINGTFGSGTVTMTYLDDSDGTYKPIADAEWTANAENTIEICPSRSLKFTVADSADAEITVQLVEKQGYN